jgi:hypothetical protein
MDALLQPVNRKADHNSAAARAHRVIMLLAVFDASQNLLRYQTL